MLSHSTQAFIWTGDGAPFYFSHPKKSVALFDHTLEVVTQQGRESKKTSPKNWWQDLATALCPDELWVGYIAYDLTAPLYTLSLPAPRKEPLAFFFQPESIHIATHLPKLLNRGASPRDNTPVCASWSYETYQYAFQEIKRLISLGDLYQINLTYEVKTKTNKHAWDLFLNMVGEIPPPYSSYLTFDTHTIASASPELFIKMENGILETRPMKGTQAVTLDSKHLKDSVKEQAELAMITDLMRNDLLAIAKPGSLNLTSSCSQAVYGNVRQQFSVIQAELLNRSLHPLLQLQKIFPGGSITGCPKRRACERIYQLEQRRRGIYTGVIGFWNRQRWHWNMAIRTATLDTTSKELSYSVGGGITWSSEVEAEWKETLLKLYPLERGLRNTLTAL